MTRMKAPSSGVKIRMYRQGHGDCFLLAFAGKSGRRKRPVYVLIDCGLKNGSQIDKQPIKDVIADIGEATGHSIDVLVMTHEHEDHVNGFGKKSRGKHLFDPIKIKDVWLAWTENENDEGANALRDKFNDTLFLLARGVKRMRGVAAEGSAADRIMALLETDTGETAESLQAILAERDEIVATTPGLTAAKGSALALGDPSAEPLAAGRKKKPKGSSNKRAMKYIRDRADGSIEFLDPTDPPRGIAGVSGLKAYALGPPRDPKLLTDLTPREDEEFHFGDPVPLTEKSGARSFRSALEMADNGKSTVRGDPPFSARYIIPEDKILDGRKDVEAYDEQIQTYRKDQRQAMVEAIKEGSMKTGGEIEDPDSAPTPTDYLRATYGTHAPDDPAALDAPDGWRRIDDSWLNPLESLALRLNDEVNNTSLVLAFELPKSKKVLLFTGDAQRGSWASWAPLEWTVDGKTVSIRELMKRCMFYKVGHHGSHNATLNGGAEDDWPNLNWMAQGDAADDFVAMIPAHTAWAEKRYRWEHPMKEIETAVEKKARGRVIRSDKTDMGPLDDLSAKERAAFKRRFNDKNPLYFEYTILDS